MPRLARMIVTGEPTVYHVMSRTVLDGFVLGDIEKEYLLKLIKHLSAVYFTEVLGFCLMGNHFHILVKMMPENNYSDDQIKRRHARYWENGKELGDDQIPMLRQKWSSLSEYMKEVKQTFSRYYNKTYRRRGFFWSDRFKSLIVEKGETLINCLAYIDLNPVRAGIAQRPEDYRWNSLGYHMQSNNKDGFLSTDFGLKGFNVKSEKERVRRYREYVYETGAVLPTDKPYANSHSHSSATFVGGVDDSSKYTKSTSASASPGRRGIISNGKWKKRNIDEKVLEKERKRCFEISRTDRFLYRTRYFTDSGIIGSREYVSGIYQQFKHLFQSKHEKKPKSVKGLDGMFSLKRLSEAV
jgi:putative transposase